MRIGILRLLVLATAPSWALGAGAAEPPRRLLLESGEADPATAGGTRLGFAIARQADGSFAFYNPAAPSADPLTLPDAMGTLHRLSPALPAAIANSRALVASGLLGNTQILLSSDGVVRSITVKAEGLDRETAAGVGLPRYLDVWYRQGTAVAVGDAIRTWRGYNGSQMEYQQLASGRLLVPHGSFIPHARAEPPAGRHETVTQYSDDGGRTWHLSPSRLTSPCFPGYNGSNEGACEPCFEELADGRIWMLVRTQAGCLYESFSSDDGTTWTPAAPSRFPSSNSPANLLRHQDGRLVLTWNHCELPPRHAGQGVYGGRDALHIAMSDDEGRTWRGFREIYLDHRRNENPAARGDRGTAYPLAAFAADGTIVVLAGQGHGGRGPILVDPDWVTATAAETDFSDGLAQWAVYRHTGPATRWYRAREVGCVLVETPGEPGTRSLHVRRPAGAEAETAVWNFPNGQAGELTVQLRLPAGSQGGLLSLNDRFFDPSNRHGEDDAIHQVRVTTADLAADTWHTLTLRWNLPGGAGELLAGDRRLASLPVRTPTLNGISYLRVHAAGAEPDPHGILIRRVAVTITDPIAPPVTPKDQGAWHQKYLDTVLPRWTRAMLPD
jgi:hypothetical protein